MRLFTDEESGRVKRVTKSFQPTRHSIISYLSSFFKNQMTLLLRFAEWSTGSDGRVREAERNLCQKLLGCSCSRRTSCCWRTNDPGNTCSSCSTSCWIATQHLKLCFHKILCGKELAGGRSLDPWGVFKSQLSLSLMNTIMELLLQPDLCGSSAHLSPTK